MAIVKLRNANDGWTKRIPCNSVQVTYNRNNNKTPVRATGTVTEITEDTFENPQYTVQNYQLNPETKYPQQDGRLKIEDLHSIHSANSTDLYLIVEYGDSDLPGGERTLGSVQSAYSDEIPVVLDQVSFNISTEESAKGYSPTGQITFVETKGPNTTY